MSPARSRTTRSPAVPLAGRWPLLERIPRRRFERMRRTGRIASVTGALVIAALVAGFVELDSALPHLLTAATICVWVLGTTWLAKQRWLRWLRDEFAGEVEAKLEAIRSAAPLN